jgi:hypothetical protein
VNAEDQRQISRVIEDLACDLKDQESRIRVDMEIYKATMDTMRALTKQLMKEGAAEY